MSDTPTPLSDGTPVDSTPPSASTSTQPPQPHPDALSAEGQGDGSVVDNEDDLVADTDAEQGAVEGYGDSAPADDEVYIGTDPIYQQHANDTEKALPAEGDDDDPRVAAEKVAVEHEADMADKATVIGVTGFTPEAGSPSEASKPVGG